MWLMGYNVHMQVNQFYFDRVSFLKKILVVSNIRFDHNISLNKYLTDKILCSEKGTCFEFIWRL
jgi:hypothetical protein